MARSWFYQARVFHDLNMKEVRFIPFVISRRVDLIIGNGWMSPIFLSHSSNLKYALHVIRARNDRFQQNQVRHYYHLIHELWHWQAPAIDCFPQWWLKVRLNCTISRRYQFRWGDDGAQRPTKTVFVEQLENLRTKNGPQWAGNDLNHRKKRVTTSAQEGKNYFGQLVPGIRAAREHRKQSK